MKRYKPLIINILCVAAVLILSGQVFGQVEWYINDRGMLHQTIYNGGQVGYPAQQSTGHSVESPWLLPAGEWPPYGYYATQEREYTGYANTMGGSIQIMAYPDLGNGIESKNRIFSLCNGWFRCAAGDNFIPSDNGHTAPISFNKIDNFPVLEDGSVNPDYNPDEAEQIIEQVFATSAGIEITRVSRQWSYPDYDDFIIYEYRLEFTGNTDNNPATIEMEADRLLDVVIQFHNIAAPSRLGHDRYYNNWIYANYTNRSSIQATYIDHDYWLQFNEHYRVDDNIYSAGMPELHPNLFQEYVESGRGGLLSPQAYGMAFLYYSTDHLAYVSGSLDSTESQLGFSIFDLNPAAFDGHYKRQPLKSSGGDGCYTDQNFWWINTNAMSPYFGTPDRTVPDSGYAASWDQAMRDKWRGRNFLVDNVYAGGNSGKFTNFGPYALNKGDVLEFTVAEVVGFGSDDKLLVGGPARRSMDQFYTKAINWNRRIEYRDGTLVTENYVDEFGYPDYVNSDAVTIQQVAHNMFSAYLGVDPGNLEVPVWPEANPKDGMYNKMKIPFPAPGIVARSNDRAEAVVEWSTQAEDVSSIIPANRLAGELAAYRIYKSEDRIGWELIATVQKGDHHDGTYRVTDPDVRVGDTYYYAVTSVDVNGKESGKTNISENNIQIGAVDKLGQVYVVPNPFKGESQYAGESGSKIGFYGLPVECTIRIYSFAGQLIETIEHTNGSYDHEYFQITRNDQRMASGVYLFVVTSPDGETSRGKFVIIR